SDLRFALIMSVLQRATAIRSSSACQSCTGTVTPARPARVKAWPSAGVRNCRGLDASIMNPIRDCRRLGRRPGAGLNGARPGATPVFCVLLAECSRKSEGLLASDRYQH